LSTAEFRCGGSAILAVGRLPSRVVTKLEWKNVQMVTDHSGSKEKEKKRASVREDQCRTSRGAMEDVVTTPMLSNQT
jgi:hypothetical protein